MLAAKRGERYIQKKENTLMMQRDGTPLSGDTFCGLLVTVQYEVSSWIWLRSYCCCFCCFSRLLIPASPNFPLKPGELMCLYDNMWLAKDPVRTWCNERTFHLSNIFSHQFLFALSVSYYSSIISKEVTTVGQSHVIRSLCLYCCCEISHSHGSQRSAITLI